jgi:hypothetical protein
MAINFAEIKKHPYAIGGVVIVGGLVVFYLLSRGSSSSASPASSSNSDYLAASSAEGQAQAAAAIQTNAQNAAIQQAQINASSTNLQTSAAQDVANTQTIASLIATLSGNKTAAEVTQSNNDAATLQQSNAEITQQNEFSIQEQGLQAQVNEAEEENANNNSTSLAGLVDTLNYQGAIASQVIGSATTLATQQQAYQEQNTEALIPTFGKQYNSALDANNAAAETLTVLSGGNPVVANTGVISSASSTAVGDSASASIINSISKLGASVAGGLFG